MHAPKLPRTSYPFRRRGPCLGRVSDYAGRAAAVTSLSLPGLTRQSRKGSYTSLRIVLDARIRSGHDNVCFEGPSMTLDLPGGVARREDCQP